MRTINFRALPMHGKEFVYGYYRHVHIPNSLGNGVAYDSHKIYETFTRIEHDVVPETVGQLTGMADIKGKLIFEGDIIIVHDDKGWASKKNPKNIGVVTWGSGNYFCNGTYCHYNIFAWLYSIEVIGNVHENGDLLPKNNEHFRSEEEIDREKYLCKKCFARKGDVCVCEDLEIERLEAQQE